MQRMHGGSSANGHHGLNGQSSGPGTSTAGGMIGQVLAGRYVITRLLGRGGMGVVYLAREHGRPPGDLVVIKMISPALRDDEQAIARFEREAKRLEGLDHPNIVRFHGFERAGDLSYLVMEYVDGVLLTDAIERKGRFRFEEFVPIAAQILKGIGHAHSRDVLLRDIKPSNIMLCERQGRANFVKLLDFGLAKVREGDVPITTAHVLGTAGYIAPEVLRGAPLDLRVDVYALGVLFYLMLSGRLPFDGEPAAIFTKTLGDTPPPLTHLIEAGSSISEGFLELVDRCLAKDPNDRPSDANEIVEEMIDVVAAPLFRLPRAASGGTTMASDRYPSGELLPPSPTGSALVTNAATPTDKHVPEGRDPDRPQDATTDVQRLPSIPPAPVRTRGWGRLALLGLATSVAGAAGFMLYVQRVPTVPGVVMRDPAIAAPPRIEPEAPDPSPPTENASEGRQVAARMRDAERAAFVGDTAGAIEAYLDVLELAPDHALAQSGLEHVRALVKERAAVSPTPEPAPSEIPPGEDTIDEAAPTLDGPAPRPDARRRSRPATSSLGKDLPSVTSSPAAPTIASTKTSSTPPEARRDPAPQQREAMLLNTPKKPRTSALLPLD